MADDVIDTMFEWVVEIFQWLFNAFLKVCGWLIKLVWHGIVFLIGLIFSKKDADSEVSPASQSTSAPASPETTSDDTPKTGTYE